MSFEEWWGQRDTASASCDRETARRVWQAAQAQQQPILCLYQVLTMFANALRKHIDENIPVSDLRVTNSLPLYRAFCEQLDDINQTGAGG